jgi:hypothetical protein
VSLTERLAEAAGHRLGGEAPNAEMAEHWSGTLPGIPAPCHVCGGEGFLDVIDVRRDRQHEHCTRCPASWVRPI